jgi:hypothetical protein
MADELVSLDEAMDRCWIEHRFDDLSAFLAPDIVVVSPDGVTRLAGLSAAVDSYRTFMARAKVGWFKSNDHVVTERATPPLSNTGGTWRGGRMAWRTRPPGARS